MTRQARARFNLITGCDRARRRLYASSPPPRGKKFTVTTSSTRRHPYQHTHPATHHAAWTADSLFTGLRSAGVHKFTGDNDRRCYAAISVCRITNRWYKYRRQRHRGRIPGNIWSAGDEMSYVQQSLSKIVIKLPAELMRTVQPAFAVQARHRDSQRENDSPYFA